MDTGTPAAPANSAGSAAVQEPRPGLGGLADLDPRTPLDVGALAGIMGRSVRSIERAVGRGELPAPFRLLGHRTWTVDTILAHLQNRQEAALAVASRRDAARKKAAASA
jgi:hypothetical protein